MEIMAMHLVNNREEIRDELFSFNDEQTDIIIRFIKWDMNIIRPKVNKLFKIFTADKQAENDGEGISHTEDLKKLFEYID